MANNKPRLVLPVKKRAPSWPFRTNHQPVCNEHQLPLGGFDWCFGQGPTLTPQVVLGHFPIDPPCGFFVSVLVLLLLLFCFVFGVLLFFLGGGRGRLRQSLPNTQAEYNIPQWHIMSPPTPILLWLNNRVPQKRLPW